MSSSLSLTPGVKTDRPVTPNDFLMSSECRGSASQVMPSAVHSMSLPGTRMLCTQSWYPGSPRIPRFATSQFQEEPSDIDDVAEKNKVVSMYPHTELLLHMAVDARWCSTLHKSNRNNNLANREFPSNNSVSAAVHALEQTTNFAFTSTGLCREFHEHFSPNSAAEVCSSHVYQHQDNRLCPGNWLYHFVGKLVNRCTNQQPSQRLEV